MTPTPKLDLAARWRKEADQYMRQVEEARKAGTPHNQMLSMATALRQCAKELEQSQTEPTPKIAVKQMAAVFEGGPSTMMAVPFDIKDRVQSIIDSYEEKLKPSKEVEEIARGIARSSVMLTESGLREEIATALQAERQQLKAERERASQMIEERDRAEAAWDTADKERTQLRQDLAQLGIYTNPTQKNSRPINSTRC